MTDTTETLEQRVERLEAKVKALSEPDTLKFVFPEGKYGDMEVLDDSGAHAYYPVGQRNIPLRQIVILLLQKLHFKLAVKNAEPERLSLK